MPSIMRSKDTFFSSKPSLNCRGRLLSFDHPRVMGIINITPDSFYPESRKMKIEAILELAGRMLDEGASILDVGAISTRPGAEPLSEEQELDRLRPALKNLRNHYPEAIISVDTYRSSIARITVEEYNVDIINDISGGQLDGNMFSTIAKLQVPYILMHMKGSPENMQKHTIYNDLLGDILKYFSEKINLLNSLGVNDIIIDPGFGFAKTIEQNYEILGKLNIFRLLEKNILVGISRKSMIYKTLGISSSDSLNGSTALHAVALINGASILRVHDVHEAVEVVKLLEKLEGN
jgi:dihydropteroate synthase